MSVVPMALGIGLVLMNLVVLSSKKIPPMADARIMMTMGLNIECRLTNNE